MERICVMVRIRPMDSPEEAKNSQWRVSGNTISLHNQQTKFEFDNIFRENSTNSDLYAARAKDIVWATVSGFNGTVFAYGQTNSGKTHTMRGKVTEPGIIPLAVHDLFRVIHEVEDREFLLRMSYMEIYNEEINDLLVPEHRRLQIHESLERGIFVAGLREEIVVSPEQVLEFMEFGESHRHIGQTNMNVYSSRSHTIFRMIIESRERNDDGDSGSYCDAVRVSVLNLVDLAGSERVAKTGAEGVRLKEGSHINKSLMTLGTVINKLSEGAESIGGHVPYRDSKLTRILQPALGGNSNTAIICNITLAQIHTDETKSSLQFASRALRVTNCAQVNEILTDAALLKRQKKEIEELRAKLMDSHSEHLEEEILSLRNTLLQSELERERIAMELQAEKKAQAQRDQRLQEQAQKIANLSSMVLYTAKDVREKNPKKSRRRETWCPGGPSAKPLEEETVVNAVNEPFNTEKGRDLFILQEELEQESEENVDMNLSCMLENNKRRESLDICCLPNEHAMLHVTHRRKAPIGDVDSPGGSNDFLEMRRKYEYLLIDFETMKAEKDLEITSLKNQLSAVGGYRCRSGTNLTERELEAILVIKQLQDQISILEKENSTMQAHMDSLVDSARERNLNASKTCDELCQGLIDAHEETRIALEQLTSVTMAGEMEMVKMGNQDDLLMELEDIASELQCLGVSFDSMFLLLSDVFCSFKGLLGILPKYRLMMHENVMNLKFKHEKASQSLAMQIEEKEKDKELCHEYEAKIAILIGQVHSLQKEISCLSITSLAKEKETLRKDLEKTRDKLKETESKLKNCIQDKVKLESERANNEREIKHLLGQLNLLERDISKRESLAGKRDKASIEQSLQMKNMELERTHFDLNILLEENKKLETTSFEMMEKLAALEERLTIENEKNEEIIARNISLASELETMSEKLTMANSQLSLLTEEAASLKHQLAESGSICTKLETTICSLSSEKEELVMQFTDALMQQEEERAIWFAKEKHFTDSLMEKETSASAEIALLSEEICKVRNEFDHFREHCIALEERLLLAEANLEQERKSSNHSLMEIDQLKELLKRIEVENAEYQDELKSRIDLLSSEKMRISEELENVKNRSYLVPEENSKIAASLKLAEDIGMERASLSKERAKLRITLRNTQIILDVFRIRHKEELELMNRKFEDASKKLKDDLLSCRLHNLDLMQQLSNRE